MVDHSYIEREDQDRAPALNYQNSDSILITDHIFNSIASHTGQFNSTCLTEDDLLQGQNQQRDVDIYTGWETGAINCSTTEYEHLSGGIMDVGLT
jgi:hypothetical protein